MPTKADPVRLQKLRSIMFVAGAEGWPTEQLDAALAKLYRQRRAPAKSK